MSSDKLELKIIKDSEGKDVDLSDMSLKESKSLIVLLEALTNIVELSIDNNDIRVQVIKGSATVIAQGSTQEMLAIQQGFKDVVENKSTNKDLVDNWRNIQNLIWANGLEYEANFYRGLHKEPIVKQIRESRQFRTKVIRIKHEYKLCFIEGQLIEVGGKSPNIHIVDKKDNKITISCTENDAIQVNKFLYQKIKISVWGKTNSTKTNDYSFCDFYIHDKVYHEFKTFVETKSESEKYLFNLHYKIREFVDEKDFGNLKKFLRLFNHNSVENSTLKTILVITKAFKNHEIIGSSRLVLKELLEKNRGSKLI